MTKTVISAAILALSIGVAHGQTADTTRMSSTADANYAVLGTPGTIGAMDAVARSVATSAEDVALQQRGLGTLAQGARPKPGRPAAEAVGYSPGTVGASPGR